MNWHWSGEITLGNVITLVGAVVAALSAWKDVSYRIKSLELWRVESGQNATISTAAIMEIKEAVMQLKTIAAGQERRLQMLEEKKG